jgi:hypothetical protein
LPDYRPASHFPIAEQHRKIATGNIRKIETRIKINGYSRILTENLAMCAMP